MKISNSLREFKHSTYITLINKNEVTKKIETKHKQLWLKQLKQYGLLSYDQFKNGNISNDYKKYDDLSFYYHIVTKHIISLYFPLALLFDQLVD